MRFFRLHDYKNFFIVCLRLALGLVFVWFGFLKIFGFNPVYEIISESYPFFAAGTGNIILGFIEVFIGFGLVFKIFPYFAHYALIVHLLGTFFVFITAPDLMFNPHFPILTISGEFIFKNIVLIAAGLVVLAHFDESGQKLNGSKTLTQTQS